VKRKQRRVGRNRAKNSLIRMEGNRMRGKTRQKTRSRSKRASSKNKSRVNKWLIKNNKMIKNKFNLKIIKKRDKNRNKNKTK
jgi:hypothetical protein